MLAEAEEPKPEPVPVVVPEDVVPVDENATPVSKTNMTKD